MQTFFPYLVNKTNRCTDFQFYWYYGSTCFGQPFCPSSVVLSPTSALVHFMQLWRAFASRSRMELQLHPAPASQRSSQLHKMYQSRCKAKNYWWWAERLPETCRAVIPIKLEFSASVGFVHKESVTMHGHTILKLFPWILTDSSRPDYQSHSFRERTNSTFAGKEVQRTTESKNCPCRYIDISTVYT